MILLAVLYYTHSTVSLLQLASRHNKHTHIAAVYTLPGHVIILMYTREYNTTVYVFERMSSPIDD